MATAKNTKKQPATKAPAKKPVAAPKKNVAKAKPAPAAKAPAKKPARPKYRYTANVVIDGAPYTEKANGNLMGSSTYVEKDAKLYSSKKAAMDHSKEIASHFRKSTPFVTSRKLKG
jgi:hypothetical protein